MSITAWDIKEAAFSSDVKDVEELILTNKGATEVGALSQAVNLRSLSLAFNSLASLSGLCPLVRLQSLNVSHNQLASLKGLQALSCLVTLNASHNKVVSLGPLSGLSCLADLWLQNNCVAAPGELRVLAGLPGLQRLAIANNPLVKALPAEQLRLVALRLCPSLRLIDGRPVEPVEQAASEALDLEALLTSRITPQGSAPTAPPPTLGSLGSLGSSSSRPGSGNLRAASHRGDGGRASASGGSTGRTSSGALGLPDSRMPAAASRRKTRSNSYDSLGGASMHQLYTDGSSGDLGKMPDVDAAAALALAAATAALEASGGSSSSFASSSGSFRSGGSRLPRSGGGRRPPLPCGGGVSAGGIPRPSAELQGTQFQAVLDALPRFDSSKLPARYNGAVAKPRGAAAAAAATKPPPDAHLVEYEAKYPAQRGGGKAVVVRRDGSAAAFWPGGDMAATVDADYGSAYAAAATTAPSEASGDDGGETATDGGGRGPAQSVPYKMMVMYRAGGVAVSWDAMGGFVQYPNGGLMLMYSRSTGSGTCYSPSGEITRRWRDLDATAPPTPPPAVAISLPFPLASPSPRAPPPPPPAHVDMQLDPHLGIRFISATHSLELFLSCETIRYRFRCGHNEATGGLWDPPPGRGDGGSGSDSAASSRVQTPQNDSLPSTPSAAAATTRGAPVVGNVYGTGNDEKDGGGGDGSLPPPSFLRNLARQGGAGSHRPVGAAATAAARQASSLAATTAGGGGGAGHDDGSAAGEGLAGIASITAGLQALDEGLQAWLVRDSREKVDAASRTASSAGQGPTPALPTPSSSRPGAASASPKGRRIGGGSGVNAARALVAEVEAAAVAAAAESEAIEAAALAALAVVEGGSGGKAMGADPSGRWPQLQGGLGDEGSATASNVGGGARRGIDSDVAEQLAAARKLAAESLAAAMAAASSVSSLSPSSC